MVFLFASFYWHPVWHDRMTLIFFFFLPPNCQAACLRADDLSRTNLSTHFTDSRYYARSCPQCTSNSRILRRSQSRRRQKSARAKVTWACVSAALMWPVRLRKRKQRLCFESMTEPRHSSPAANEVGYPHWDKGTHASIPIDTKVVSHRPIDMNKQTIDDQVKSWL